jgi:hypothetical protein
MNHYIHDEVNILFKAIDEKMEKERDQIKIGMDILDIIPAVAINTLWYIIAGERHDLEDERFVHLTHMVLEFFRLGDAFSIVPLNKTLQKIPIINRAFKKQVSIGNELNKFVKVIKI